MKRVSLLLLLLLAGCNTSITAGTVMDVTNAEANIICSNDVKLQLLDIAGTCYDSEKLKLGIENNGEDLAGIVVNGIQINRTISGGGIFIETIEIENFDGNLVINPVVEHRGRIFVCKNALEEKVEKC